MTYRTNESFLSVFGEIIVERSCNSPIKMKF
jgi:hypothetical protein